MIRLLGKHLFPLLIIHCLFHFCCGKEDTNQERFGILSTIGPFEYCDDLTENFERGYSTCWFDNSPTPYDQRWRVAEYGWNTTDIPRPTEGRYVAEVYSATLDYISTRAVYEAAITYTYFYELSFDYYIRSSYWQSFVEVKFKCNDGREYLLDTIPYNLHDWTTRTVNLGYCYSGGFVLFDAFLAFNTDAIALDNIVLRDPAQSTDISEWTTSEITSESPTAFTTAPYDTTTLDPGHEIVYDFATSLQGWTLFNKNGALWTRQPLSHPSYAAQLLVQNYGAYSGIAIATSPLLQPLRSEVTVELHFWSKGSAVVPAQLKLFKQGTNTEPEEFADLTLFSEFPTLDYQTITLPIPSGQEPFRILLKGYTGQSGNNSIAVARIVLRGVAEIPEPSEIDLVNSSDWSRGFSLGSYWYPVQTEPAVWEVRSQDPYPGMATLESVALPASRTTQTLKLTFLVRGSPSSPAELTLRRRSASGVYEQKVLLDLREYGTIHQLNWQLVETSIPPSDEPYQIIMEGFLCEPDNYIGVKNVVLSTRSQVLPGTVHHSRLFEP